MLLLLALVKAVLFKAFWFRAWHAHGPGGKAGGWHGGPPHGGRWGHGPKGRGRGPCCPWDWDQGDDDESHREPKDEQYGKAPSEPDAA